MTTIYIVSGPGGNMCPDINESSLLEMAKEKAAEVRKKECTTAFVKDEAALIKSALEMMDISNIYLGPFSNTALQKIDECLKVLSDNFEEISEENKKELEIKLNGIRAILDKKAEYGKEVDEFLKKRESNLIDIVKDRLLDADLAEYEKIMNTMSQFKTELVASAQDLCNCTEKL